MCWSWCSHGRGNSLMDTIRRSRPSGIYISRSLLPLSRISRHYLFTRPSRLFLLHRRLNSHDREACERPVIAENDELDNLNTRKRDHARQMSNDLQLTEERMVYQRS
jgi:hypothetical protein